MSVSRPVLSANFFDISEVDTFVLLQAVAVTSVVNGGSSLVVNVSDPNAGADLYKYTYHLYRSVDGGPFVASPYQTGAVQASLTDGVYTVATSATATTPDGTVVTLPTTAYIASATSVPIGVLASPVLVTLLLDTVAGTPTGTVVVPAGTPVTVSAGFTVASAATPLGHAYSYEVSVQNKYQTTVVSAASSVTVAPTFAAQTLGVPTRTGNVVSLAWTDANSYSVGDRVEVWRRVGAGAYSLLSEIVKTSAPMPTAYADAFDYFDLAPATYGYKVRAVSDLPQDTGPFSNIQSIVVPATLSAPTGISAVVSGAQVNLAWTDPNSPSVEAGLYVYRDTGDTTVFTRIAVLSPGAASYADFPIMVPGQVYAYKVAAFNSLQLGPASATASATSALATPAISSVVQAADVGAVVAWTDANTLETTYTLQRSVNGGAYATVSATIPADTVSYEDAFSEPVGTFVAYRIKAENATVTGAYSAPVQIVLGQKLVAPGGVRVVISGSEEIAVSWKNISPLIRGTLVFRSVNGAPLALAASVAASVTEFDDGFPVVSGAVYAYSVQSFDNQESGPASAPVVATTPFDPPQDLQVVVNDPDDTATLSWTTHNSLMDYTSVEAAFSGTFTEVVRVPRGQVSATVTIGSRAASQTVSFRVREVRQPILILSGVAVPQNLGLYSLAVSTDTGLSAPSSVAVTRPTPTRNLVTWGDSNTLATGFEVWRQVVAAGPAYEAPILVGNDDDPALRAWTDAFPMSVGTTVRYWVYAVDADTSSPQSNAATLTTRIGRSTIAASQTARAQITLTITPPAGYSFVAGDQIQVSRSVSGSAMNVVATVPASSSPVTYVDGALSAPSQTNGVVSYLARFFSATEAGPDSATVDQVLYDAVFMPLGAVSTVKIFGSRSTLTPGGRGVFAGCASGLVKVTNDPSTLEPVLTQSGTYTNTVSVESGDLVRAVAAGNTNQMFLIDAATLSEVVAPIGTTGWSGASNDTGLFDASVSGQSASFTGSSIGVYKGWALAVQQTTNVKGIAPWNSAIAEFQNYDRTLALTSFVEPFIALPFLAQAGASVQPAHLEALGGDALCFVLQTATPGSTTTYNTTMFRVQRSTNRAIEVFNIPNYVVDAVSDGVSKVLAVDVAGSVWLVDTSLVPPSAGSGYLGYNPLPIGAVVGRIPLPSVYVAPTVTTPPVGHPGDLINLATGSISIELGAGRVVATALYNGQTTTVHVFSIPVPPMTIGQTLTLAKTFTVNERVGGLAFDGGVFFYGRSIDTSKLFRFNAGL